MRIAWLTDLHLNVLDEAAAADFLQHAVAPQPEALVVTGDLAESRSLPFVLQTLAELETPCYFVLGNHDYYFSSLEQVRAEVRAFCRAHPHLHYLTGQPALPWGTDACILGHDGWADARLGDYERSNVELFDHHLVAELHGYSKEARWPVLQRLGQDAAAEVRRALAPAVARYRRLLFLTHVPPFRGACWYNGAISDDEWLPHFTCHAVGETLLELLAAHPDCQMTVLCGHTHGQGEYRPLENLRVLTGRAEYGRPEVQTAFTAW